MSDNQAEFRIIFQNPGKPQGEQGGSASVSGSGKQATAPTPTNDPLVSAIANLTGSVNTLNASLRSRSATGGPVPPVATGSPASTAANAGSGASPPQQPPVPPGPGGSGALPYHQRGNHFGYGQAIASYAQSAVGLASALGFHRTAQIGNQAIIGSNIMGGVQGVRRLGRMVQVSAGRVAQSAAGRAGAAAAITRGVAGGASSAGAALSRLAGPIVGVAAGVMVAKAAFDAIVQTAKAVDRGLREMAHGLEQYSPKLALARATQDLADFMADFNRAQKLEGRLSEFESGRRRMDRRIENMKGNLAVPALDVGNAIVDKLDLLLFAAEKSTEMFVKGYEIVAKSLGIGTSDKDGLDIVDRLMIGIMQALTGPLGFLAGDALRDGVLLIKAARAKQIADEAAMADSFLDKLLLDTRVPFWDTGVERRGAVP